MGQLYSIYEETLKAIADSVRTVTGTTGDIPVEEFAVKIVEGGVAALPELTNEGTAADLMANKELIDGEGNKVTGTFTIDSELTTQDSLISQIQTALEGKATATPKLQEKTATPTTSSQTITPDSNYDGLSKVTVNAMPTATQATPSVSIDSAGKITATATQTAGYVSAGTKTGTKQLTTQAAKTITPSTSSQTAVAKNVYTTGVVTVGAIPSTYVKPTTTKTATTYTPTTSNQTIAAGTYCSGIQTIKGDANLKAENIAEGVSIFGVTGTHSGGGSGGGSAPMIVSGKVASNISASSAAPTQSVVATVGGLGFKPFCVMIRATNTVTANASVTNYFIGCQYADGMVPLGFRLLTMSNGTTSVYTGGNMIAYVETTEDGFILYNGDFTNMYYPSQFDYIAIG